MQVLAVTPTFFPIIGGAELLIRDVLNVWSEDHSVRLLTRMLPESSRAFWTDDGTCEASCRFEVARFEDRLSLMDVRGHRASRGLLPPMSLTAVAEIERQIAATRPSALVGFFGIPYGLPLAMAASRHGLPLVIVLCGNDIPSPRTVDVPFWSSYLRRVTARADQVVYVSRFCFDVLNRRPFREPHDIVVYGGIDLERRPSAGRAAEVRERLGVGPDEVLLFTLSRLGPEKRVDVLVRALAELRPLTRRVRLVVGGQGPEAETIARLARGLGVERDVIMAGHLGPEKAAYYEACDIFVFHSLFETFGQVAVEAMAAAKPVVSVRAGAIPEVVEEGVTGLLAEPEDAAGLAAHVATLADDARLRREMGLAGRDRAERLFDWRRVRRQWQDVLALASQSETADESARARTTRAEVGS